MDERAKLSIERCQYCRHFEGNTRTYYDRRCLRHEDKKPEHYDTCDDWEEAPDFNQTGDWRDDIDTFEEVADRLAKRVGWSRYERGQGVLLIYVDSREGKAKLGNRNFVRIDINMVYKPMFGDVDYLTYSISASDKPVTTIRDQKQALDLLGDILEEKGEMEFPYEPPARILELD